MSNIEVVEEISQNVGVQVTKKHLIRMNCKLTGKIKFEFFINRTKKKYEKVTSNRTRKNDDANLIKTFHL